MCVARLLSVMRLTFTVRFFQEMRFCRGAAEEVRSLSEEGWSGVTPPRGRDERRLEPGKCCFAGRLNES
ncbi:hypothetical protein NDU88_001040 [Pleurodeles waltl]|uniref:Secreted protein n=1 Tax=Pleurodeles waltl TaxID=8319 RepID=A0AAV7MKE2_PLEWA|nr:hypothetical protein NDU88_001040 [Pleurodeles waltl]